MKNKKLIIAIVLCITLVISFGLLTSYALWRVSKTQSGRNVVSGACLDIDIEQYYDENENLIEGITLDNAWPISDAEGTNLPGYSFKVINKCEEDIKYQIVLDSLVVSGEGIDPEYVKVKLDDKDIRRYDELEDADEIGTGSITSKKIYTGIIPKKENGINGEVSHTLKQWISEDSTDDIGKSFSSKIRVIAGQNIELEEDSSITCSPNPPALTSNDITIGTEDFYYLATAGNYSYYLAKYNLQYGNELLSIVPGTGTWEFGTPSTVIRQGTDSDCNKVRGMAADMEGLYLAMESGEDFNELDYYMLPWKGLTVFSDNNYYKTNGNYNAAYLDNNNYPVNSFAQKIINNNDNSYYVYDEHSAMYNYVSSNDPNDNLESYYEYLHGINGNVVEARLMTYEEAVALGCDVDHDSCLEAPEWLTYTSFWLGSSRYNQSSKIWSIDSNGNFMSSEYDGGIMFGVRPVITISLS